MRHADSSIPIHLGNLRQEIEAERIFLRYRLEEGDKYSVFPKAFRKHRRKRQQTAVLLSNTIEEIWQQFKHLERPFLIRDPLRAEQVRKGDYWGDSDVAEKPHVRPVGKNEKRLKNRMGMAEAGLSPDQETYYRTDLTHRFIWWQSRSAVDQMSERVQRVQIRRIERDTFETDELVKKCVKLLSRGGGRGGSGRSSSSSGSDDGPSGGKGPSGTRRNIPSRPSSARAPSRRASATGGAAREIEEVETIRTRRDDPNGRASEARGISRPRQATPGPRYEYEVIHPRVVYVDAENNGQSSRTDADYRGPREGSVERGVPTSAERRRDSHDGDRRFRPRRS